MTEVAVTSGTAYGCTTKVMLFPGDNALQSRGSR